MGGCGSIIKYNTCGATGGAIDLSPSIRETTSCRTPISPNAALSNLNSGAFLVSSSQTAPIETPYFEPTQSAITGFQRASVKTDMKSSAKSDDLLSNRFVATTIVVGRSRSSRRNLFFWEPVSLRDSLSFLNLNKSAWSTRFSFVIRAASFSFVEARSSAFEARSTATPTSLRASPASLFSSASRVSLKFAEGLLRRR